MKEQFKAAAKLVNEWRDTVSYTCLASAAVAYYAISKDITSIPLGIASGREMLRGFSWLLSKDQMLLVGASRNPVNKACFYHSSLTGGFALMAVASYIDHSVKLMDFSAMMIVGSALFADGPVNVVNSYKTMWDWPRKRDGDGGGSQTTKIRNSFVSLAQGLGRRVAPTAHTSRQLLSTKSAKTYSL